MEVIRGVTNHLSDPNVVVNQLKMIFDQEISLPQMAIRILTEGVEVSIASSQLHS